MRGLKLLREPFSYYLQTIIVKQYRHSVGQRHTFHIIHLIETTALYILPDIWDDGKNRLTIINLFTWRDIWSVGKEPIVMFEFTTWHASFTDFFIKLRRYTDIGKQLFISNDRHRVRWEVLGLSQDGVCTDSCESFSVKSLRLDQSKDTKFSPPSFLIGQYIEVALKNIKTSK